MSREAFGDPPESQEAPDLCPVCGNDWHAEDCVFGREVARRLKAERDAHRMQFALHRLWPALERAMAGLVFTADRAGEVAADMNTLREYSKTPHCPKGDGPCIRGCKGWECRDGWPDDPTLKPDIAALKKRLAEDQEFAAEVTGDRPLRRNVDGVCTRSACECEREGLGDQCVWLKPVDAQEHVERLSQYVMQQDMRIADLERELHTLKMAAEGDQEAFAAVVEHKRKAESECRRLQGLLDAAHKIVGELARPSGI